MATQHPIATQRSHEQAVVGFRQLEDYAWHSDPEFQNGLQAILGPNPSPEQAEHLILRARCFYFARYGILQKNTPIDFNAYQSWRSQQSSSHANGLSVISSASDPSPMSTSPPRLDSTSHNSIDTTLEEVEATAPYPTSFSQIVELITSGHPIPGIKEVPNIVLEGQASQMMTARREKPWEKDNAGPGEELEGANRSAVNTA